MASMGLNLLKYVVLYTPMLCFHYCFKRALTAQSSSGTGSDTLCITDSIRKSSESPKVCPVIITKRQFCALNQEIPSVRENIFVVHTALNYYITGIIYPVFMALRAYCIWVCSNNFTYLGEIVFYMVI